VKKYIRIDGAAVDVAQEQSALAQCKGEGATAVPTGTETATQFERQRKERAVIDACMARNGYIGTPE
jgi:hypothetical protein